MKKLCKENVQTTVRPERVIQFGEGNFLRAFVDWIISYMNEKTDFNGSVVVVQPIEHGMIDKRKWQGNKFISADRCYKPSIESIFGI